MNWWNHSFSQNKYEKLSEFLPCVVRAEILTIFCSYVFWEKWWLHKFILKITDLYLLQTFVTSTYIIFGQYVSTKISSVLQSMYILRNKIFHYVWFFVFPSWYSEQAKNRNRQKILFSIQQRFSCLLDEWIAKICKYFFFTMAFFKIHFICFEMHIDRVDKSENTTLRYNMI